MASTISPVLEVILYPTRATRSTTEFSRETMEASYFLPPRPQQKTEKFRVSVTWGSEEAFTISNLGKAARGKLAKSIAARLNPE